jgi:hypothetical protein
MRLKKPDNDLWILIELNRFRKGSKSMKEQI